MAGALMALLTPDLRFSFTQYRYYEFMIVHGLIMFSIMYMLFVYDFVPGFDSLKKSFFTVHLIGLVMIPFNYTFNASYMLLVNKPSGTILDLFGEWPVYLIGIELLLIILFSINYSLIYFFILRPKTSLLNDVFLIIKDNGNSIV
jgi:hypothetical integral membrane protein (TIGR02206 family)